jgi:hypothetical protein
MTARQRRWHLILWLVLGPVILIGLAAGLAARRDVPIEPYTPGQTESTAEVTP